MIDFNDETHPLAPENRETERNEIRAELIARLPAVLVTLFPAGKKRQGKFLVGDVLGAHPHGRTDACRHLPLAIGGPSAFPLRTAACSASSPAAAVCLPVRPIWKAGWACP